MDISNEEVTRILVGAEAKLVIEALDQLKGQITRKLTNKIEAQIVEQFKEVKEDGDNQE